MVELVLLVFLGGLSSAHAWYEPSVQRWINRDPVNEFGWNTRQAQPASFGDSNPYLFVENSPITRLDPLGNEIWILIHPRGLCYPPQNRAQWSCTAKCQMVPIPPNTAPAEYITGEGEGSSEKDACNTAKNAANQNVRRGFYKRHCDCTCSKGKRA